jgi:hypothetical protein
MICCHRNFTRRKKKNNAQNQALDIKFYIIKRFNILIKSIAC